MISAEFTISFFQVLAKTSRPRFWLYVLGPIIVCLSWLLQQGLSISWYQVLSVLTVYSWPANMILYGVNDLADEDTDAHNQKKDSYEAKVTPKNKKIIMVGVWLALFFFLSLLLFLPWWARGAHLLFLALAWAYSMAPVRFKSRPFFDSYSNILYVIPAGVLLWWIDEARGLDFRVVIAAWTWTAAMHAYSAIPDQAADAQAGVKTVATYLGTQKTLWFCAVNWLITAFLVGSLTSGFMGGVFLLYPALMIWLMMRPQSLDGDRIMLWYTWFPVINAVIGAFLTVSLWTIYL